MGRQKKLPRGVRRHRSAYRGVISYQLSDSVSSRFQLDNEHIGSTPTGTDFGIDLHFKWEGE